MSNRSDEEDLTPDRLIALYKEPDPTIDHTFLSGIYDVDWAQLDHAHGEATDVPALLRALLSDIYAHRDFALQLLFETIWHQSSVGSASAYTAPFLIHLLNHDTTPNRGGILYLLAALAEGNGYRTTHQGIPEEQGGFAISDQELKIGQASHEAVAEGIDTFLKLTAHPDPEIQMSALYTLSRFPEHAMTITPHLEVQLHTQTGMAVKGHILLALNELIPPTTDDTIIFEKVFQNETNETLQTLAAYAVLTRRGTDTSNIIIDTLRHTSTVIDTIPEHRYDTWAVDARFYPGPWGNDRAEDIAQAFAALGLPKGAHTLMTTLKDIINSDVAHTFGKSLLGIAFAKDCMKAGRMYSRTKEGRDKIAYFIEEPIISPARDTLTFLQQDGLRLIADHDPFWEIEHNLLELYGLPSERSTLREWLDG